jgi:hypothetical protein
MEIGPAGSVIDLSLSFGPLRLGPDTPWSVPGRQVGTSAAARTIPDRVRDNAKDLISMDDLIKRVWHGNIRKQ